MINVKEEFLSHPKTRRAVRLGGEGVVLLWLNLRGYVAESNTGGFVPDDAIEDLPLLPKNWRKAMEALIECGKKREDGTRGAGLVEQVDHGYQLHDYEDHGTPVEVEEDRRRKAREQKHARRLWIRHQTGQCKPDCPHCVRGQKPDRPPDIVRGQKPDTDRTSPPDTPRAPAGACPPPRGGSQPSPAQPFDPTGKATAKDLTGQGPPDPPRRSQQQIPCPKNLWDLIPDESKANLTMGAGIPDWAQRAMCQTFVMANEVSDGTDHRTETQWIRSVLKAIAGDWSNPKKRPPHPDSEQAAALARDSKEAGIPMTPKRATALANLERWKAGQ